MSDRFFFTALMLMCGQFVALQPACLAGSLLDKQQAELGLEELSANARPALVVVRSTDRTGKELGQGAGFVIDTSGLIATARHVIGDGRDITVELADSTTVPVTEVYSSSHHLDLAILRVKAEPLTALTLSPEDDTAQGREVVALGHPRGQKNLLARGIVSGHLEIDGIQMLHLTMPIEPGNSGGPVLDRLGRVVGIVTMKSTAMDDTGFAIPARMLRDLQEHPNPIPIDRWRTIGVMDERQWTTVFGANWRQRAGRISVTEMGSSFGGRTLCLRNRTPEQLPYDVSVTVRLGDEQGAAGLVFHSDGADRHYGFYPSAGNLRLTRFNGPDVGSWTILHNQPHAAYRPGEWNTLVVRITDWGFQCFVNGTQVLELADHELPPGKAGLAAFRGTGAEFRSFAVGQSLIPAPMSAADQDQLQAAINELSAGNTRDPQHLTRLDRFGASASAGLEAEARKLERRAAELRILSQDLQQSRTRSALAQALQISEPSPKNSVVPGAVTPTPASPADAAPDLMLAALLLAQIDNPEIDPHAYLVRLNEMASEVQAPLAPDADSDQKLRRLDEYLFEELGFRGSRYEYYSQSNSFMNEVIDDREGLPITLSVLYMELARRIGLNVAGVGLPGHFVVRFEPGTPDQPPVTIDPFDRGRRLTEEDVTRIISSAGFPDEPRFRAASTPVRIIERMTLNLLRPAESERNNEAVLRYLETLVLLAPDNAEYRAKRLEIRARTGRTQLAVEDADWFIREQPDDVDIEQVRQLRQSLEESLHSR